MRRLLAAGPGATSRLSAVEVAAALARRCREGAFAPSERDRALAAFDQDLSVLQLVEVSPAITLRARALLVRHPLRTGDAIQLASALFLQDELGEAVGFAVFDHRLQTAAAAEGLSVLR